MKKVWILLLFTSLFACKEVTLTGRKQFILLPDNMMTEMGISNYQSFLAENERNIISTGEATNEVNRIGKRISSAVERYLVENGLGETVDNYKWEFSVIKDDTTANAWCMPGGKVVVYTGILPVTQTEAGLAVVMGHEIAHAVANHGNERMSQNLLAQTGFIALDIALQNKPAETRDLFLSAYGMGSELGILLPFSRTHETEADRLGLIFMAMAGYDPNESISFWERMAVTQGDDQPPAFMSTHPGNEQRIADLRSFLPEALTYFQPNN